MNVQHAFRTSHESCGWLLTYYGRQLQTQKIQVDFVRKEAGPTC